MGDTRCHNDYDCHLEGEKRQNLINAIKVMLDKADDRPCLVHKEKRAVPPMMVYPGYVNSRHPALQPKSMPNKRFLCHLGCHKYNVCAGSLGPSDDPKTARDEENRKPKNIFENVCTKQGMTSPGAHYRVKNQSVELKGGVIHNCCDCLRRNGMQDQCPRTGCGGSKKCTAPYPGPCCVPAMARKKFERC